MYFPTLTDAVRFLGIGSYLDGLSTAEFTACIDRVLKRVLVSGDWVWKLRHDADTTWELLGGLRDE